MSLRILDPEFRAAELEYLEYGYHQARTATPRWLWIAAVAIVEYFRVTICDIIGCRMEHHEIEPSDPTAGPVVEGHCTRCGGDYDDSNGYN